jgi:hypothetical protein
MEVSKNFILQEFIDPVTWKEYGNSSLWFIDRRVILIAQKLRDKFGKPITINNWDSGGTEGLSGYRPPDANIGGFKSQHKFGRAADLKIYGMPLNGANELRDEITKHFNDIYYPLGLTVIENGNYAKDWCHFDCRWTGLSSLFIVNP